METIAERLQQEFECAITATFGDLKDKQFEKGAVEWADLVAIAKKVAFYLDLN